MNDKERAAEIARLRAIGKKGGAATRRKSGKTKKERREYYQSIGSKGGKAKWAKEEDK